MKIGLVLSGGGMRGAAHIGMIKALEEYKIYPTYIAGSSAGAIVGALYAYGYNWKAIFNFFKDIQLLDFNKYALGKPGIIDAEKFYPQFNSLIKDDNFNALKKSLFITATDILKGKLKIFSEGELIKPILASAAFPGVFAPVKIGNSYFIDGGVLDNFPVRVLKSKCDVIIGSYVNCFDDISMEDLKHSHNVVERAFKLKAVKEDYKKIKQCDIVISPKKLNKYGTFDKKYLKEIFNIGYSTTIEALKNEKSLQLNVPIEQSKNR
ncbi:patatin-like phospholipase family protein [Winogradskyella sp.]|uniref:patatin-like phospholipase family protein n=1 Tax=Winogradskyella sp. TaxID=1883156 RepID=UPI003F6D6918